MKPENLHDTIVAALILVLTLLLATAPLPAREIPEDPLDSAQWRTMYSLYLEGQEVVFDARVKVLAPAFAEDSLNVPVMVDARTLGKVEKLLVFADWNPLPKVLEYYPVRAEPRIGFKLKLQQRSPVRAAALTPDGVWHLGGVWVDAAGGGCTAPSVGSANPEWIERLGEIEAGIWPRKDGPRRLRFSVVHPMDTGLAGGIPHFYIETLTVRDADGRELAVVEPYEPISENPVFSLNVMGQGPVRISGRDNNGNTFASRVTP